MSRNLSLEAPLPPHAQPPIPLPYLLPLQQMICSHAGNNSLQSPLLRDGSVCSSGVVVLVAVLVADDCWVLASSLAPRKVPGRYQEQEVCPVGIASLLCGGCHRYEVMMSFCWGQVAPFFLFCPHVRSFELRRARQNSI